MAILFFYFFVLILALPFPISSSTVNGLREGQSLSVEEPNDVLVSPNGVFTTGFFRVGDNAYCFAIWFTKPSSNGDFTVAWMANRDHPVNGKRSKLSLLGNGDLILTDGGQLTWRTETVSESSVQLQLEDTGNLRLQDSKGVTLWQSFDSPTNTLLPQQQLTRYTKVVSSRSSTNYSAGYYKLFFDDNNVLRLAFDGPETSSIYWPLPWFLDFQAGRSRYNDSRTAVLDSLGHFLSSDLADFYASDFGEARQRRLTLDYDGNLRLYSFRESDRIWSVTWQAMPQLCRIHGTCGPNGICSHDPGSDRRCSCPPGFKMKNQTDWVYGCEPENKPSCDSNDVAFLPLARVDFYGYDYDPLNNCTLEMCKKRCLELCCDGFQFQFSENEGFYICYPKRQLRNGHRSLSYKETLYLRLPESALSLNDNTSEQFKLDCSNQTTKLLDRTYQGNRENKSLKILLWFACVIAGVEVTGIFLVWCCLLRTHEKSDAVSQGYLFAATGFKKFTYKELKKATRGFSEEIGRGGGGTVYKGVLSDQRVAAIKRLNEANQGEAEFLAEVSTIGTLNHMNLIEMWGYCAEGKYRLLVYEYMEHGSLAENLWSNSLDWEMRYDIAVGTAKGLAYLHEECLEWVLHCDVKPQNILLDSNYQPKVADFGLSKLLNRSGTDNPTFSRIRGTRGYMAPEWVFDQLITSKVDVYSYGIVVLEMITAKNPSMGVKAVGGGEVEHQSLVSWVREKRKRAAPMASWVEEIMNPMIRATYKASKLETLVGVALQCVEEDKEARPTMNQVVEMLERQNPNWLSERSP